MRRRSIPGSRIFHGGKRRDITINLILVSIDRIQLGGMTVGTEKKNKNGAFLNKNKNLREKRRKFFQLDEFRFYYV